MLKAAQSGTKKLVPRLRQKKIVLFLFKNHYCDDQEEHTLSILTILAAWLVHTNRCYQTLRMICN